MTKGRQQSIMHVAECVAAGAVCGFGLLNSVAANPPASREKSALSAIDTVRSMATTGPSAAYHESAPTTHLDLRPPKNYPTAIGPRDAPAFASAASPSSIRRLDLDKDDRLLPLPPALATDTDNARVKSPSEAFVARVRREGLPFARLWESKSALLSIGLSPKGKPGLWLTQKIR
jgi:hypothetical protein